MCLGHHEGNKRRNNYLHQKERNNVIKNANHTSNIIKGFESDFFPFDYQVHLCN